MKTSHGKLLKRVRISLFALTAIVGVSTVMAMKPEAKRLNQNYRFISEEANHFVVQQSAVADGTYDCNTDPSDICTVESAMAPQLIDGQYKLEKTSSSTRSGNFEEL